VKIEERLTQRKRRQLKSYETKRENKILNSLSFHMSHAPSNFILISLSIFKIPSGTYEQQYAHSNYVVIVNHNNNINNSSKKLFFEEEKNIFN
jgi:hypothetical protein